MKKRLTIYTTIIVFAGLVCFFIVSIYNTYENNLKSAEKSIIETTRIYANLYNPDTDLPHFVNAGADIRVTVITAQGDVIADSSPVDFEQMESHLDRPEVQDALNDTPAVHMRYSSTLGTYYLYYALKADIKNGSGDTAAGEYVFIRTSVPVDEIDIYLYQSLPVLILVFFVIAVLCFILIRSMINRIAKPLDTVKQRLGLLTAGQYHGLMPKPNGKHDSYEEIDAIVSEIDDVAQMLQTNVKALENEKSKAEYFLNNITDAVIAADDEKDIMLVNNTAQGIFEITADITGKNIRYLSGNTELINAVNDCIEQKSNIITEITLHERTYILTIKYLEDTQLTMIILSDITESRASAKQREEFFENASHELKTPLTAIKGFGELCVLNNKDEKINKYIEGIVRETDRMLTLISDMLKLSQLSATVELNPEPVVLTDVISEIEETLSASIEQKELTFEIVNTDKNPQGCIVSAQPEHVFELLKNLIENAVRYNNQNGRVTVSVSHGSVKISDTGIGIPTGAQSRLFERFYRVEKSRSIQSGGTGLGLAIVKHICNLYGWNLSLRSNPAIGTEVTVMF